MASPPTHPTLFEALGAACWGEAWGGPPLYSRQLGTESSVVRMHSDNGPHAEMDRHAIDCFDQAMTGIGLADAALGRALHDHFIRTRT